MITFPVEVTVRVVAPGAHAFVFVCNVLPSTRRVLGVMPWASHLREAPTGPERRF